MGVAQIQLPEELKAIIDRRVSEGLIESEAAYLEEAIRLLDDEFEIELGPDAELEIRAVAEAGIAALKRGDFSSIASEEDAEAFHERAMERLRANLAADDKQ